jgi:hypothetical protein
MHRCAPRWPRSGTAIDGGACRRAITLVGWTTRRSLAMGVSARM